MNFAHKNSLQKEGRKEGRKKFLSLVNEYTNNSKTKVLYLFGLKIPIYKREKTEKYTIKNFLGIRYSKKQNPDYIKLIMTLLVKNEEEIIETNIRYHIAMGVDGVIVTDNGSTDKTVEILEKLKEEGLVLEIIHEPKQTYEQEIWVARMIKLAKEKYGATWVINADADEFYYSKSLNLKESIKKSGDINSMMIYLYFLFPDDRPNFLSCPYFYKKIFQDFETTMLQLSPIGVLHNENMKTCTKVIHKTEGFISIIKGNHNVTMKNQKMIVPSDITCYHYHVKNYKEYEEKTKRWIETLKYLPKMYCGHLRRNLELFNNGKLKEEYEKLYNKEERETLTQLGAVSIDLSVYNFLKWKGLI